MLSEQEVLTKALAEGENWLSAFKREEEAAPGEVLEALKRAWPEDTVLVAKTLFDAASVMKTGVAEMTGLSGEALENKIAELRPWDCVWDYYDMAFFESACGTLGEGEPEFTKHSMLEAFSHGLAFLINLDKLKIGVCRPIAYLDGNQRLHREEGPAIKHLNGEEEYWWHGAAVKKEWITNKDSLDPKEAWRIENLEQRRCFFEIVGWFRILEAVNHKIIMEDETGTLIEADLPLGDKDTPTTCKLVKVTCPSTGRVYALLVSPTAQTAKEGVAGTWSLESEEWNPLQHT